MVLVIGAGAVVLFLRDQVTLRKKMSRGEREAAIKRQSNRTQRWWFIALFVMSLVALPVHAFGLVEEPLWQRLLYFSMAAVVALAFVFGGYDRLRKNDQ